MKNDKKSAVLLLGHGSKLKEANDTLRRVAASVEERGGYQAVVPAFLQMERPDFQEAVDSMTEKGFTDITVMPYFLYPGAHVTKDLPEEIEKALSRHPGLRIDVTGSLGFHDRLVDITIERIGAPSAVRPGADGSLAAASARHPIELESFSIIENELGETSFSPEELSVVKRVIHATADFEFKNIIAMSPGAVRVGMEAVARGRAIVTDVRMVEAGITLSRLAPFGASVMCFSADGDVAAMAEREGVTKTAASMRKAAAFLDGAVAVIGNAPTALSELLRLMDEGSARPALVIGVPVGFVGAVESKERLMASGVPYISTKGRKGGSTVAVAIVNAIALEAARKASAGAA